ncbi:hypothetical protein H9N25_19560 [Pedobacter riviphilus]|uniref:Uncharacterized protein n=1 Tax=Pedobacter riviphilus TaxID=2766984 RepID=A0ABX6TGK4_9SPHI|nr:hypothetical protein [Pedobacter riviphilus]QNR84088.1 hypothetical protein H9N25_19560 [Pedobacter riviphilus]
MDNKISLIAFATCGNPYGFRQTFFGDSNKSLANRIKTFDLNTNAIKLFPHGKVYGIRRELVDGNSIISYAVYSFAKEQNSSRGGTFIGSGIIFENEIADENITINKLNEFHRSLVGKNIQNDIILVNHSNNFSVSKLKDFDKINFNLRKVENLNFFQPSNLNLVIYSEIHAEKLQLLFKKAIDLLNVYDTIYFTDNNEIAEFVIQKGLFKLVKEAGFEQEIQNLHEERKRKIQAAIIEFEKEKERLDDDKARLIQDYKQQIERNEKLHEENKKRIDESKNAISFINQNYESYSKKIDISIDQLKAEGKLEEVQRLHNENKRIFIERVNQQKIPISLANVQTQHVKTGVQGDRYPEHDFISNRTYNKQDVEDGINIYKIISLFLFILLVGVLIYFFVFYARDESSTNLSQEENTEIEQHISQPQVTQGLIPSPNFEINKKSYKILANKIEKEMALDQIVQLVFDTNPSDVKEAYIYQKVQYGQSLINLNNSSFKDSSNTYYFTGDTLRHIPAYRDSLFVHH